ncbi:MAG: hypothetical protein M1816_005482 [Peltula sp. TS41687]|nr:MAG: hypothetical protein M1816_005482 [Peltula sp. TS41687]
MASAEIQSSKGLAQHSPLTGLQNSETWNEAVNKYKKRLTTKQCAEFERPASAAECLNLLQNVQFHPRKLTKTLNILQPVVEPLKRFEGVVDVLVQTSSGIASPIWGPLRLAITVICNHNETLERLVAVLEHITTSLNRFTNYETLFETDQHVQDSICNLYVDLLNLMVKLIAFYSKPLKRFFSTFDGSFGRVASDIDFHSREIDWAANAASINYAEKARKLAEASGIGCGKSTLAAFVIDHLMAAKASLVLFFFCNAVHPEKQSPLSVIRTILAQMVQSNHSLVDILYPLYLQSGRVQADSLEETKLCLSTMLHTTLSTPIIVVIDGFDECSDPTAFFKIFDEKSKGSIAKLLLTSRPTYTTLELDSSLLIEPQRMLPHVGAYVSQRLSHLTSDKGISLVGDDVLKIKEASEGLWLYVRLIMDEIERAPTAAAATRIARNRPRGLEALYESIIRSASAQLSPEQLSIAQRILLWVNECDYIPSDLTSAGHGILQDTLDIVVQHINYGEPVANLTELATVLCVPLLQKKVVRIKTPAKKFDAEELTYVHLTLSEYVSASFEKNWEPLPNLLKPQRLGDLYRAETAIWYFSECSDSQDRLEVFRSILSTTQLVGDLPVGPYLSMSYGIEQALSLWTTSRDAKVMAIEERAELSRLMTLITDFCYSNGFLRWIEMSIILNYLGGWRKLETNLKDITRSYMQESEQWGWENESGNAKIRKFNKLCRSLVDDILVILDLTAPWNNGEREGRRISLTTFANTHGQTMQMVLLGALRCRRAMLRSVSNLPSEKRNLLDELSDENLDNGDFLVLLEQTLPKLRDGTDLAQYKSFKHPKLEWTLGERNRVIRWDYYNY